jgi:radical SAM protein with 4Fe4S-binding SPASM domain
MNREKIGPLFSGTEEIKNLFGTLSAPITIDWEITMSCNLSCIHCCFNAGKALQRELNTSEIKSVISEISDLGVFRISFTGGEPLMRSDFLEIAEYAYYLGLGLALNTNGTLIDKKVAKKLSKIFFEVQVSLDGSEPEINDYIRGKKGAYKKALKGIINLKEAGSHVVINTTAMKPNINNIFKILDLAIKLGVDCYRIIPVRTLGRASKDLELNIKEMINIWRSLAEIKQEVKEKIKIELTTVPTILTECVEEGIFACPAAITKCAISPQGFVKPCDAFDIFVGGNIRDQTLQKIWLESEPFKMFRNSIYNINPNECRKCIYARSCRGGCKGLAYTVYKTLDVPDPLCTQAKNI